MPKRKDKNISRFIWRLADVEMAKSFHGKHDQLSHGRRKGKGGKYKHGKSNYPGAAVQKGLKSGEVFELYDVYVGSAPEYTTIEAMTKDLEGNADPKLAAAAKSMVVGDAFLTKDLKEHYGRKERAGRANTDQLGKYEMRDARKFQKAKVAKEVGAKIDKRVDNEQIGKDLDVMFTAVGGPASGKEAADLINRSWADSSSANETSLGVQKAVADRFGLTTARSEHHSKVNDAKTMSKAAKIAKTPTMKAFVESTYENTQSRLKDAGIDELYVYRGTNRGSSDLGMKNRTVIATQAASSWTTNPNQATPFGDTVMAVKVPRERIFSTARTGAGCLNEAEVIILGGELEVAKW